MSKEVLLVLFIGTCLMMISMIVQLKKNKAHLWKAIPTAFILTICGTVGTYLWYFVENFEFGGRSFFGAVFIVPLLFIPIALLLRISYNDIMDMCAPAECVMLCIMKIQCMRDGCCMGRILGYNEIGEGIEFPSQLVEFVNAILVFAVLMFIFFNQKRAGTIYPWYLIVYGISRFVLNFFRAEWQNYDGGLPPFGTIWSVVSIIIGIVWLVVYVKIQKSKELTQPKI